MTRAWHGPSFASLAAVAALMAAGCAATEGPPPSICGVSEDDLVVFPADGQSGLPTNTTIRVLAGGGAADLRITLYHVATDALEPGIEVRFGTTFGELLELTPDFQLEGSSSYEVEVSDRGVIIATARFTTTSRASTGAAGADGPVTIEPLAATERTCCGSAGCLDGTLFTLPPLDADTFTPQLVLLTVDEHFNTACGAQSRPVAAIPVVVSDDPTMPLEAETDLLLEGCFSVDVVTQTLRRSSPGGVSCTLGFSWNPGPVTAACDTNSGCNCQTAPHPGDLLALLSVAIVLVFRRRRWLSLRS